MRHRSRLAVVLHEPELGGATRSLLGVFPLLEERGWQLTFWVPGRGSTEASLRERGYAVAGAERRLRFSLESLRQPPGPARRLAGLPGYLRSWRAWLRSQEAALLHVNSVLALPELVSKPRGGPPAVLHVHEILPDDPKGGVAARMARRADAVVAVSWAVADVLRAREIASTVVYAAVDPPGPRRAFAGRTDELVVGTLGTISKRKGSDLFLAAAERVREQRSGVSFRLVGDPVVGGERPWAERVLATARERRVLHRAGVEPFAELAEWDIFVLPSRLDPCPLAVLEAMSVGLPVIGTRVGGIPEELGADAGLLVEPEDVEGLATAIIRLADSPPLRRELGESARRRVERLFTVERQAEGLDRVYRRLLGPDLSGPAHPRMD